MQQLVVQHKLRCEGKVAPKGKGILSRPAFWIAAALLFRFGMDLFAEKVLKKKGKRRKKDVP